MRKLLNILHEISMRKLLLICLLFLCVIVVILAPRVYSDYQDRRKERKIEREIEQENVKKRKLENEVSEIKKWRIESQASIGAKEIRLETKWKNGNLLYKFDVDLTGPSNIILANRHSYNGFDVEFLDSDSFKLFSFHISLNNMTSIVDENGVTVGLSANNEIQVSAVEYKKIEGWSVGWNF